MLFATVTGLGASSDLVDLKKLVDGCVRSKDRGAFTSTDAGASDALTCGMLTLPALQKIEKVSFISAEDQQLVFAIARTILQQWRQMGVDHGTGFGEVDIRKIAAEKLLDTAFLAPDAAVAQFSSVGRFESDPDVLLRIINGMAQTVSPTTAANIRTEVITTLGILTADPDPAVRKAAQVALDILKPPVDIEIGPVTVTPAPQPHSKALIPALVIGGTAIAAAGVLWFIFGRQPATYEFSAGPFQHRVEARARRRRSRRSR